MFHFTIEKKMSAQITDTLMMIRPVTFHRNEQTAVNNYYQKTLDGLSQEEIQANALREFDEFVSKLRAEDIDIIVFEDTKEPETPDSIFPNNWVSFHESGEVIMYPMYAENRRLERRDDLIEKLGEQFKITTLTAFIDWEEQEKYLEGTGSLIFDRKNQIAYAAISERTHPDVIADFVQHTGCEVIAFQANQTVNGERLPIYHTNVMMCVGEDFAVICDTSIDSPVEKKKVLHAFKNTGKEVIFITDDQKERFAGNMLHVKNKKGDKYVVMSESAFLALDDEQKSRLSNHGQILHSSLDTIECLGGGSARCMMAEVFLPRK
jgi:hypothetical protein